LLKTQNDMELLIIILVLLLVAVIAGPGLLLYHTISRRNVAMQQMAQAVNELAKRLPEEHEQHTGHLLSLDNNNHKNN